MSEGSGAAAGEDDPDRAPGKAPRGSVDVLVDARAVDRVRLDRFERTRPARKRAGAGLDLPGDEIAAAIADGLAAAHALGLLHTGVDAHAYWSADPLQPYRVVRDGELDAYFYAPVFAQVLGPLHLLPWPWFIGFWTLLLTAALVWQAGLWTAKKVAKQLGGTAYIHVRERLFRRAYAPATL